jgi:mono/diheme cytochrome c family protein
MCSTAALKVLLCAIAAAETAVTAGLRMYQVLLTTLCILCHCKGGLPAIGHGVQERVMLQVVLYS